MSRTLVLSGTAQLRCDSGAPRAARHLVQLLLRQWQVEQEEVLHSATLVVSELVTNVLLHCRSETSVEVGLELRDGVVRVEVADREPAVPTQRAADAGAENGRGLAIVAQLSQRWGVEQAGVGKRVYAELPLPACSPAVSACA